jgi:hypothetical protein
VWVTRVSITFASAPSSNAPLNAELFVKSASPAGLPTVEQENLTALEDDDVHVPTQRRRVAVAIVGSRPGVGACFLGNTAGAPAGHPAAPRYEEPMRCES